MIQFGDHLHTLWGPMAKAECQDVMSSVRAVAGSTIARVQAEMSVKDLEMAFCCFDLRLWQKAKRDMESSSSTADWRAFEVQMCKRIRRLAGLLGVDAAACQKEFFQVALDLLADKAGMKQLHQQQDNRCMWARALGKGNALPSTAPLVALPSLVCWYLSVLDGECGVERDLASLRVLLSEHEGSLDADGVCAADLLEVHLDGPRVEQEVALQPTGPAPTLPGGAPPPAHLLTDFSRRCVQVWASLYGRRFRCYRKRADAGVKRKPKEGTFASLRRSQATAVNMLYRRGKALAKAPREERAASTVLGFSHQSMLRCPDSRKPPSAALSKFDALTARKAAAKTTWLRANAGGSKKPSLRIATVFGKNKDYTRIRHNTSVLDTTGKLRGVEQLPGRLTHLVPEAKASLVDVVKCEIVLVESAVSMEQITGGILDCTVAVWGVLTRRSTVSGQGVC